VDIDGSPRGHAELVDDQADQVGVNRVARLMAAADTEGIGHVPSCVEVDAQVG
jgi:hypothetical protein